MGHKISKEQIDPSVKDHIMSFVGNKEDLETSDTSDIINAVNSLIVDRVDNINNINKLANSIGNPVTASDNVDEVCDKVNGLLSTFKTNMMNSGIMVEGTDKFKQLIDKIKGLTEGEGNKGIHFAEGTFDHEITLTSKQSITVNIPLNLNFVPNYIFIHSHVSTQGSGNVFISNLYENSYIGYMYQRASISVTTLDMNSCILSILAGPDGISGGRLGNWYAIGVGEEDTILEDSLRDILANKGVEVTEEDDLASLITKVDSIDIHQPLIGSNIIYDNGTINTELTGGLFLARPYDGNAKCTFETDHIYVYPGANSSADYLKVFFRCRHPFSVYGYNKIKLTYATKDFTKGGLTLQTEVYDWVSASSTSHNYTKSNPDSITLKNTGGSSNITETILEISDNTIPINIAICLEGIWSSSGVTQAGIYIHKIELLK